MTEVKGSDAPAAGVGDPVEPRRTGSRSGWGWIVLLSVPPILVIGGLIAFVVWQGAKGGITPKWRKQGTPTNAPAGLSASPTEAGTGTR